MISRACVLITSSVELHAPDISLTVALRDREDCGTGTVTATVTTTVTDTPPTVTIAVADSFSISRSLSSAASVDSVQVSQESEDAPVSEGPVVATVTFVHSIVVPAFEATEVSNSASVYYVSVGPNTTDWGYTPAESITVGVTTVTVQPTSSRVPTHLPNIAVNSTTLRSTTLTTATVRPAFPGSFSGGNGTHWNSSVMGGGRTGSHATAGPTRTLTVTGLAATTMVPAYAAPVPYNTTITLSPTPPAQTGYGLASSNLSYSYNPIGVRQTCTLVSAYINSQWASWCNNWDGSTTLAYTTWETTSRPPCLKTLRFALTLEEPRRLSFPGSA